MANIKVKNSAGAWESVAMVNIPTTPSTGGELAYATITSSSYSGATRKFDISNYVDLGTIYVMISYNSYPYVAIITNGVIESYSYGTNGSAFTAQITSSSFYPQISLTDGILSVTGSTLSNVKTQISVIYTV